VESARVDVEMTCEASRGAQEHDTACNGTRSHHRIVEDSFGMSYVRVVIRGVQGDAAWT
jgi:hypothetical protein